MRRCEACCREFTGRSADCPWCGFNNATKGGPRSRRMVDELTRQQEEREEHERELEDLSDAERLWLELVCTCETSGDVVERSTC